MFILGFMSDKNILSNPKFRLIIQLFIISSLVLIENLKIEDLRILFLDQFLDNQYFNYFLTIFCIAILINGSNFIDGLNGLLSGYCLLILFSFLHVINLPEISFDELEMIYVLIYSIFVFFIFNILGKVYLGDSGSYLLATIIGYIGIKLVYQNPIISPYFIASVLWYPVFENLFSLIRRIKKKEMYQQLMVFIYINFYLSF